MTTRLKAILYTLAVLLIIVLIGVFPMIFLGSLFLIAIGMVVKIIYDICYYLKENKNKDKWTQI